MQWAINQVEDKKDEENMELLVPTVSDIVFKYSWPIQNYKKTVSKSSFIDSPTFDLNVNGIRSTWSLSIRFWKGPEGKSKKKNYVEKLALKKKTSSEVH